MNQRSKEIINQLIEINNQSLKELSEIYEVSERTIRNDVASLNEYLNSCHFGTVEVKNKKVVLHLTVSKDEILQELNQFNVYDYKFSSEERSVICLLILISHKDYVTLNQLSDKLLASRSTIVNDVKNMRKIARKYDINIISKASNGYKISANESDIRLFLFKVLTQDRFAVLESIFFEEDYKEHIQYSKLGKILSVIKRNMNVSEKFLDDFYRYMVISSYRNLKDFHIEAVETLPLDFDYSQIEEISYDYLTKIDCEFIYRNLVNASTDYDLGASLNGDAILVQVTAMKFIEKISADLSVDFKNDYTFYENLSAHLLRMFRNEYINDKKKIDLAAMANENPLLNEIVLKNLYIIENELGRKVTAIERDYILIHVYAALERKKRIGGDLKVAVITKERASEVFLIESKLANHFSFYLDIYSINDTILGDYDLILTTTPLSNKDYVYISPSITDEDYILISRHVNEIVEAKKKLNEIQLNRQTAMQLLKYISDEIDKDLPKQKLKERIREKLFAAIDDSREVNDRLLQDFLTPDYIELNVEAKDWKDSIFKAGNKLIDNGDIDAKYLNAIIDNIEQNGPYVIISKGFAFPHAQLGDYNKKTSMNLIRLAHPIYYSEEIQDDEDDITTLPVKYVCVLSAIDKQQHLKAVFNLFNLLKDSSFKDELDKCETAEQVYNLIKNSENVLEMRR